MGKLFSKIPDDWDLDLVFAYDSVREVRVLDRRLGVIFYSVQLLVFFYVVIGVFMIHRKHEETEKAMGWILSKVRNTAHSDLGVPWDIYDIVTNPGEQGAVFIPTRIVVTKGQTQENEYCPSPLHPCTKNDDCDIGNEQLQQATCVNGQCLRRQWCPAEDPNAATSEVHRIGFENIELWFQTYVHFHRFMVDVSTTDEEESVPYPKQGANTLALRDLIRTANLKPKDIWENGAIIKVEALYDCNLDRRECKSNYETANIDTKTGFNHVYNHHYIDGGIRKRDTHRMYGIRVVAFATGIGTRTSMSAIMLQISSALALLGVARSTADFALQHMVPERRHYIEQKVLQTEDFNVDS